MSVITIGDVMSRDLVTLKPDHSLKSIEGILALMHVRHLPVEDNGKLVGLVTHRDLLAALGAGATGFAKDIMTQKLETLPSNAPALKAGELMEELKIGCVPIVDDGRLVGVVTEADFLKFAIRELSRMA